MFTVRSCGTAGPPTPQRRWPCTLRIRATSSSAAVRRPRHLRRALRSAVLNLDFDYKAYLKTLEADGLNLTRTFSGALRRAGRAFNIAKNTLAPVKSRFICPGPALTRPATPTAETSST